MDPTVRDIIETYDPNAPLSEAWTIPASWYVDPRILDLERQTVFARTWQIVGRVDQVRNPGEYITCHVGNDPLLVIRGNDGVLRAFFNVCRHHAAAVVTGSEGHASTLRCPYHGWTYSLNGELKGTPDLSGVCNFDRSTMGLRPVEVATWEKWIFVRVIGGGPSLENFLGDDLRTRIQSLSLAGLKWVERRQYVVECNWKVFVDNYLDGGYHIPHVHRGLHSVLSYPDYAIENGQHFCLQTSPLTNEQADRDTGAVRTAGHALYYWIYPNFMINWYEGIMDTNVVLPRGVDQTEVVFDFYFADTSNEVRERNIASIAIGERIQHEDAAICESVQRGLKSRAYVAGRLSVEREAGEQLFHQLLYASLKSGL
jgi:choline monooxygenase